MRPFIERGRAKTPGGGVITLHERDGEFTILRGGEELMSSRRHASEDELGRAVCRALPAAAAPRVLVAGLGLGFTLRAALEELPRNALVLVCELLPEVVRWNRELLAPLNGYALADTRVRVVEGDVLDTIVPGGAVFEGVMLDVDNGPEAFTDAANARLYGSSGLARFRGALGERGALGLWSSEDVPAFEKRLRAAGFDVERHRVRSHPTAKGARHVVWVAKKRRESPRAARRELRS
jgi:spermidine synthase